MVQMGELSHRNKVACPITSNNLLIGDITCKVKTNLSENEIIKSISYLIELRWCFQQVFARENDFYPLSL